MTSPLAEHVRTLAERGETEAVGEHQFVSVLTLESGMRYGVVADGRWAVVEGDTLTPFAAGKEILFVEVLEVERKDFDAQLEKRGEELGFGGDALLFSFPVLELVAAMLGSPSPHFRRLSLMWLRPTELRDVRDAIVAVANDRTMPHALRELAQRMVVPGS